MNPTDLCVSLETARKLNDAGFPQGESYFVWANWKFDMPENEHWHIRKRGDMLSSEADWNTIAAPTVAEILKELPDTVIRKIGIEFEVSLRLTFSSEWIINKSLPEALALLWLKTKGRTG